MVLVICTYKLNFMLVCRTFRNVCTYVLVITTRFHASSETTTYVEHLQINISFEASLKPVYFRFNTILHHIRDAAFSNVQKKGRYYFLMP